MKDITKCSLIRLTVIVVLRVASLHLYFHIFKKAIFPLTILTSWVFRLIWNQGSQRLQIAILFHLLLRLLLLSNYCPLSSLQILLVPPLEILLGRLSLLFCNIALWLFISLICCWDLWVWMLRLHIIKRLQVSIASKSHQQRVLM